jgi:hypothetical protein
LNHSLAGEQPTNKKEEDIVKKYTLTGIVTVLSSLPRKSEVLFDFMCTVKVINQIVQGSKELSFDKKEQNVRHNKKINIFIDKLL